MEAQDRLLELILSKQDEMHDDVRIFAKTLNDHINDDKKMAQDVWVIKRVFQATWGAVVGIGGLWLAWLGIRNG